ncbi:MAG: hypothetical protein WC810_14620 [Janthinobacterium sp.]|jgi:hypothetical protein
MTLPKKFYKMSIQDQEAYLVDKLKKVNIEHDQIMKLLGKVRGGYPFEEGEEVSTLVYEKPNP